MQSKLLNETMRLLRSRPRFQTYSVIAQATGLSAAWVQNLTLERIENPNVAKVETLYNYLSTRELAL